MLGLTLASRERKRFGLRLTGKHLFNSLHVARTHHQGQTGWLEPFLPFISSRGGFGLDLDRSSSLGACNYPIFLSRRFHRPIYFKFKFTANSDPRRNINDQSQERSLFLTDVIISSEEQKEKPPIFFPYRCAFM